jgi:site-specific recombinase XerD
MIENKIKEIIKTQPKIIGIYSQSFNNKTAATKMAYVGHVINFSSYLTREFDINFDDIVNLKSLNYSHIVSYIDYIKNHRPDGSYCNKEDCTCATELFAIKHFCKYLKLCRYIDYNPCDDIEIPKDKKNRKITSLTPEEIQKIKNNICNGVGSSKARATQEKWKNRDLCIVFLGITTGLRVSAIANIDIDDINFKEKYITTIEKGANERVVFLSDKMIDMINIWLKDREKMLDEYNTKCDALFISSARKRIGVTTIRDMISKYTYNINKKITPHKLRSTTATNLYNKTGDIYLVADVLGHKNIQNTRRYAQVSDDKRMLAANKLSDLI